MRKFSDGMPQRTADFAETGVNLDAKIFSAIVALNVCTVTFTAFSVRTCVLKTQNEV